MSIYHFHFQQETERIQENLRKTQSMEADSTSKDTIPNMSMIKEIAKRSIKEEVHIVYVCTVCPEKSGIYILENLSFNARLKI